MGSACPLEDRPAADDGASGGHDHYGRFVNESSAPIEGTVASTSPSADARDEDHGSIMLFRAYSRDQLKNTNDVEAIFRDLRKKPECVSEFNLKGPRTNAWRMGARLCCVNTPIYNDPGLSKSTCIRLMQKLLGEEYCPAETTLKKCHDGFWIVAVSLSVLIGKLVTPYRAAACFKRFRNQKYAMTEYGFDLLRRHGASWPPYPEAASETATATTTHHNNDAQVATTAAAPSAPLVNEPTNASQMTMQNLLLEMLHQEPAGRGKETNQDSQITPSLELLMGVDLNVQQVEVLAGSVMLETSDMTHDISSSGDVCFFNNPTKTEAEQAHGTAVTTGAMNDGFPGCDIKAAGSSDAISPAGATDMQRAASLCMLELLVGPASQELHSGLETELRPSLNRSGSGTLAFLAAHCNLCVD